MRLRPGIWGARWRGGGWGHTSRHRERGPRRRGVWDSTSPRSLWLRAWGWGYEGCNTMAWLRLNQGQGPASVDTPRGSPRNGAGKNGCASSLEADRTDALQHKRKHWILDLTLDLDLQNSIERLL